MTVKKKLLDWAKCLKKFKKTPEEKQTAISFDDVDFISDSKASVIFNTPPLAHAVLYLLAGAIVLGLIWASFATLDVVTRAEGKVIPSSEVKIIQNLEGGIVKSIDVQEGELVEKGQILAQLDSTRFSSEYKSMLKRYYNLKATNARLKAQASYAKAVTFPEGFEKEHPELASRESKLFKANMEAFNESIEASKEAYNLANEELQLLIPLAKEKHVSKVEILRLKRDVNSLKAAANDKRDLFHTQALSDFNANKTETDSLAENLHALKDRMQRTIVRSPVKGIVNNLMVTTVGGVIQPGMHIMEIVPIEKTLVIEARIKPADIGFLHIGEKAMIKFTAYDYAIYGGLAAKVTHISANTVLDQKDGAHYFEIKLKTEQNYLGNEKKHLPIIPGMITSVDIMTGKKSVLDYILKPILKAKSNALTER